MLAFIVVVHRVRRHIRRVRRHIRRVRCDKADAMSGCTATMREVIPEFRRHTDIGFEVRLLQPEFRSRVVLFQ